MAGGFKKEMVCVEIPPWSICIFKGDFSHVGAEGKDGNNFLQMHMYVMREGIITPDGINHRHLHNAWGVYGEEMEAEVEKRAGENNDDQEEDVIEGHAGENKDDRQEIEELTGANDNEQQEVEAMEVDSAQREEPMKPRARILEDGPSENEEEDEEAEDEVAGGEAASNKEGNTDVEMQIH